MIVPLLIALLLTWVTPSATASLDSPVLKATPESPAVTAPEDLADALYREIGLEGTLERAVFLAGHHSMERHGLAARTLAIADLSQPSNSRRLYIIDLESKRLVLRTLVAHGQGSGELMAERFGNDEGSHRTSLGLYRVGSEIVSPKHGPALLLDGLDIGTNDQARAREVIIHGADYVSDEFIAENGRLGRSWGCPAVPRDDVAQVIELLADGGLLYVYAGSSSRFPGGLAATAGRAP